MIKNIILFAIGSIIGGGCIIAIIYIYYQKLKTKHKKFVRAIQETNQSIEKLLLKNNEIFSKFKEKRDKKYMEEQLKIKMWKEEEMRRIDEETLNLLKEE